MTLFDCDHFGRLLLVVKAQFLEKGSGSVEAGQLALCADDSRADSRDLSLKKKKK